MEKDYFLNAGIPPPRPLRFESSMPMPISDHSFLNPNSTMDQFSNLDSSWSSMFSSTTTADAFALRELIGTPAASPFASNANLPSSTSPKLMKLPILDQINLPSLASSAALSPPFSTDPGFAERAAKFSSLGSRSFNGRTPQFGANNGDLNPPLTAEAKLPSLKQKGSLLQQVEMRPVNGVILGSDNKLAGSGTESSDSEQVPSGSMMNSRKRKAISRGKSMEERSNSSKRDDDRNSKPTENGEKAEEECKAGSNDESNKNKTNQKPPEPPKDYIHVRARRGQATDSHSLAERVRREKISERMKLLQDLVPGCNKVTGKAVMLDEIINYVQSLQRQVEFLSMKLASVNPALDFNIENLLSKDMFQRNTQMYPLDSSSYHNQNVQHQQQLHCTNISSQCSVDPLPFDRFHNNLPQLAAFTEDDLHSIVQMGFVQNSVNFPVQNQTSNMKVEL